jgi:phenylacetate-coenzyme A ligase PaaK-like adenylate-forming protein
MSSSAVVDRDQHALQELVGGLMARDRWSPEQIEQHRDIQLRSLIEHAVARSSYYREVLGAEAADRPLDELPVLTKATLMERFDQLVTDPNLRQTEVDAHLAGPNPGSDFAGEYELVTTSGTTGARGVFVYSREEMRVWLAANLRAISRLGAGPGMRLIGVGSPSPLFMSRRVFAGLQRSTSESPPDLSVTTPIAELVAGLNDYQPEAMLGYPSVNAMLAEEQLAGRLKISPRVVACGSEVLTEDHAKRIEAAWGIRPGNAYVATEVCPIASSCSQGVGLHVCDDLAIVEVVDQEGRPVPDGSPGHRILVTNLVNRVQPLIRYEITDSVTMAAGPNPTGMPWRRIERIDGRTAEILSMPGREGGTVELHPHRLRAPFARLEEIVQYQFEWGGDRLAVALVLRTGAGSDVVERVAAALTAVLEDAGVGAVRVEPRIVDSIAREPGGAAKLKQIKVASS